jgi:hypothetical protein
MLRGRDFTSLVLTVEESSLGTVIDVVAGLEKGDGIGIVWTDSGD